MIEEKKKKLIPEIREEKENKREEKPRRRSGELTETARLESQEWSPRRDVRRRKGCRRGESPQGGSPPLREREGADVGFGV